MLTVNQYIKLFRPVLAAVDRDRQNVEKIGSTVQGYAEAIVAARERIKEAQTLARGALKSREAEVGYFRYVWPRIYGQLFYFQRAHAFLMERSMLDADETAGLIQREKLEARRFFRVNREFWLYYNSLSPMIDGQFTREYSRGCIYDPLCVVIDQLGATLASHRAAWGVAYTEYHRLLVRQGNVGHSDGARYEWKETKSAAVELIKSQAEAGSIYIDGKAATAVQLKEDFESKYNVELKGFDLLLYATDTRKKEATPYLIKLMEAFKGRKTRLRK